MALLTIADIKEELGISDTDSDTLLTSLLNAVVALFEKKIDRTLESATYTEYHSSKANQNKVFLKNYPVTSITSIHDDPDWDYGSGDLLDSDDYNYDDDSGIVYYDGYFYEGFNNIKVVYEAGYTSATIPKDIKQCLIRQMAHWFKDAKGAEWAKSSVSQPGGGTIAKKELKDNLLPDFVVLAEQYRRPR